MLTFGGSCAACADDALKKNGRMAQNAADFMMMVARKRIQHRVLKKNGEIDARWGRLYTLLDVVRHQACCPSRLRSVWFTKWGACYADKIERYNMAFVVGNGGTRQRLCQPASISGGAHDFCNTKPISAVDRSSCWGRLPQRACRNLRSSKEWSASRYVAA